MVIYERIDQLLKDRSMSRRKLAEQAGIPFSTISSAFARKSKNISMEVMTKIAECLSVSADFLLGITDGPTEHFEEFFADREGVLKYVNGKMRLYYDVPVIKPTGTITFEIDSGDMSLDELNATLSVLNGAATVFGRTKKMDNAIQHITDCISTREQESGDTNADET